MDGSVHPSEPPATLDSFRQQMLDRIPGWYSPWGHLAGTVGVGVVALTLGSLRLDHPRALELLTVPLAFVFANLTEWLVHRELMHRRRRPFSVLYDRHTPEHHRVYRYRTLSIKDVRELRLVLIPAAGVLGIVLLAAPVALALAELVSPNSGWLFLMTSAAYVVGYELSHLAYHLPETSPVYRLPGLRALREHHARHHLPRLMQTKNFNVTIPLGDLVFGTIATTDEVRRILRESAERE